MRLFSFISFWRPDKGSLGSDQHLMWHCFSAHGQWFLRFSVPFLLQLYPDPACSSGPGLTMFLRLPDVFLLALSAVQPYSRMAKTFYMIPQLVTPWKKQFSVLSSLIATNCAIPPRRPKPFYIYLCMFSLIFVLYFSLFLIFEYFVLFPHPTPWL